jgi:hypothetical protein
MDNIAWNVLWFVSGLWSGTLVSDYLHRRLRRESDELLKAARELGKVNDALRARLKPFTVKHPRDDKGRYLSLKSKHVDAGVGA